jgi:hypothetical protein
MNSYFSIHIGEQKNNMKSFFIDLYCITKFHASAKKWASFKNMEKVAMRELSQKFFTLFYC